MSHKLRLYHYWRSSSSWRVRWAMALKKVSCDYVAINLLTDESDSDVHKQRNPMGYVPVLEFLDKNQAYPFLAESVAIIEWLEESFPSPSLLPGSSFQKAKIRQLAEMINSGTQPLQNPSVLEFHSVDKEEQKRWSRHWIHKGLGAYETIVRETAGRFSVGDSITLADLFLIPQCYNALRNEIDLSQFPKVEEIYKNSLATESCQASAPERFQPVSTS